MWADRLREQAVAVHAMHPGWPDTPGVRRSLPAGLPPGRRCGRRSSLASIWRVDAGQVDGADVRGWMARPLIDQIFLFCAVLCGVGRAARRLLPSPAEFGKCGVMAASGRSASPACSSLRRRTGAGHAPALRQ